MNHGKIRSIIIILSLILIEFVFATDYIPPVAVIDDTTCMTYQTITVSASNSYDPDGRVLYYSWGSDTDQWGTTSEISLMYKEDGEHILSLAVVDNDSRIAFDTAVITVFNRSPFAVIDIPDTIRGYDNIKFSSENSYDIDGTIVKYYWSFDNGAKKYPNENVTVSLPRGDHTVYLKVTDNDGAADDTTLTFKVINNYPVANAGDDQTGNIDDTFTFNAQASYDPDGDDLTYLWTFPDGTTSTSKIIQKSFAELESGKYVVTLEVEDIFGLKDETQITLTIENYDPVAVITAADTAKINEPILLSGENSYDLDGEIVSYKWIIDGTSYDGESIAHIFTTFGDKKVELTVTDDDKLSATAEASFIIKITNEGPTANITITDSSGLYFDLSAANSTDPDNDIDKYEWELSDNSTYTGINITHTFPEKDKYEVKLIVTDKTDLSDETILNIDLTEEGEAEETVPLEIYDHESVITVLSNNNGILSLSAENSYDNDAAIISYLWEFSDQTNADGKTVTHTFTESNDYTIKLTCRNSLNLTYDTTLNIQVDVPHNPKAYFVVTGNRIRDNEITLDASNSEAYDGKSIISYKWEFSNGKSITSTDNYTTYTSTELETIEVLLTITDNGNLTDTYTGTIQIKNVLPTPLFTISGTGNINTQFNVDASESYDNDGDIVKYTWYFGDNTQTTGLTASHQYTESGTKSITLTVIDNDNGQTSLNKSIYVENISPSAKITVTEENKNSISLTGISSTDIDGHIAEYYWELGDGAKENEQSTSHQYYGFGSEQEYIITLTVEDNYGATGSDSYVYTARNDLPTAIITLVKQDKNYITLSAVNSSDPDGEIQSYYWTAGDTRSFSGSEISYNYFALGDYDVTLKVTDDVGGTGDTELTLNLTDMYKNPYAIFRIPGQTPFYTNQSIYFDASASTADVNRTIEDYTFTIGDKQISSGDDIITSHSFSSAGLYTVTLTITDDFGLTDDYETDVYIEEKNIITVSNPDRPILFVANSGNNNIKTYNVLKNNEYMWYHNVDIYPVDMVFSENLYYVFSADAFANNLSYYSVLHVFEDTISANGAFPYTMDIDNENDLIYYTTALNEKINIFDYTNNSFSSVQTGLFPFNFTIDKDNNSLYVANYYSSSISRIEGTSIRATFNVPGNPYDVDIDTNTNQLFITSPTTNKLLVMNLNNHRITDEISITDNPREILVDSEDSCIYVTAYNTGKIYQFDIESKDIENIYSFEKGISSIDKYDSILYVANELENKINVLNVKTGEMLNTITNVHHPKKIKIYTVWESTYNRICKFIDENKPEPEPEPEPIPVAVKPVAVLEVNPDSPSRFDTVKVDSSKSYDSDGEIISRKVTVTQTWNSRTGFSKSWTDQMHAEFNADYPGEYTISLSVIDNSALEDIVYETFIIINKSPIAKSKIDTNHIIVGQKVHFSNDGSYDPDGNIVMPLWKSPNLFLKWDEDGNYSYTFTKSGTYTIFFCVKDLWSGWDTNIYTIVVDPKTIIPNIAPVAILKGDTTGIANNTQLKFDGSQSYDQDGTIIYYVWDFGDNSSSDTSQPVHVYTNPGTYLVRLKVTDNDFAFNEDSIIITITKKQVTPDRFLWFVSDDTGSDVTGDGSEQNPFKTITYAVGRADTNDTVYAYHGLYKENVVMKNGVDLIGCGAPKTIIDGQNKGRVIDFPYNSTCMLANFTIQNGSATSNRWPTSMGGGITVWGNSKAVIKSNIIKNNQRIGGIFIYAAQPFIKDNLIVKNNGSGIYMRQSQSHPILINNTIADNNIGITMQNFVTNIPSCTGRNNILWNNKRNIYGDISKLTLTYSCIQDGYSGTGNIIVNPLFVNPDNTDYHLQDLSQCIDNGDPNDSIETTQFRYITIYRNLEGVPVLASSDKIDIGAYQRTAPDNIHPVAIISADTTSGICDETIFKFNGDKSYDNDGTIVKYEWDFGDQIPRESKNTEYQYDEEGTHTIKLTVTDNDGAENTAQFEVYTRKLIPEFDIRKDIAGIRPNNLYATITFEDLYPRVGDGDFNDFISDIVGNEIYNLDNQLEEIQLNFKALARSAGYKHSFHINVRFNGKAKVTLTRYNHNDKKLSQEIKTVNNIATLTIFPSTRKAMQNKNFANNTNSKTFTEGYVTKVKIELLNPELNPKSAVDTFPYDPYLYVKNTRKEIHLPNRAENMIDKKGYPFAVLVPVSWDWPKDQAHIENAYPQFKLWRESKYVSPVNWYDYPDTKYVFYNPLPERVGDVRERTARKKAYSGDLVTYAVNIKNTGQTDLKNIVVTDIMPAGLKLQTSYVYPKMKNVENKPDGQTVVTWEINKLDKGDTYLIYYRTIVEKEFSDNENNVLNNTIEAVGETVKSEDNYTPIIIEPTIVIPPEAILSVSDTIGFAGNNNITFDATQSFDTDGVIMDYKWSIGDTSGNYINKVFDKPGTYTVTLKIVDNDNLTDVDSAIITILPLPELKLNVEEIPGCFKEYKVTLPEELYSQVTDDKLYKIKEKYKWGKIDAKLISLNDKSKTYVSPVTTDIMFGENKYYPMYKNPADFYEIVTSETFPTSMTEKIGLYIVQWNRVVDVAEVTITPAPDIYVDWNVPDKIVYVWSEDNTLIMSSEKSRVLFADTDINNINFEWKVTPTQKRSKLIPITEKGKKYVFNYDNHSPYNDKSFNISLTASGICDRIRKKEKTIYNISLYDLIDLWHNENVDGKYTSNFKKKILNIHGNEEKDEIYLNDKSERFFNIQIELDLKNIIKTGYIKDVVIEDTFPNFLHSEYINNTAELIDEVKNDNTTYFKWKIDDSKIKKYKLLFHGNADIDIDNISDEYLRKDYSTQDYHVLTLNKGAFMHAKYYPYPEYKDYYVNITLRSDSIYVKVHPPKPEPVEVTFKGKVTDDKDKPINKTTVYLSSNDTIPKEIKTTKTNKDGEYKITLKNPDFEKYSIKFDKLAKNVSDPGQTPLPALNITTDTIMASNSKTTFKLENNSTNEDYIAENIELECNVVEGMDYVQKLIYTDKVSKVLADNYMDIPAEILTNANWDNAKTGTEIKIKMSIINEKNNPEYNNGKYAEYTYIKPAAGNGIGFIIDENNVIPIEKYRAEIKVLGSAITYGGRYNIPVTVKVYAGDNSLEPWNGYENPINGNVNDSNNPRTYLLPEIYDAGTPISVEAISWKKKHNSYDGKSISHWEKLITVNSNSNSKNVKTLRNGDDAPDIKPFQNQSSIESFLKNYIIDGKININDNEAIYLFELGTSNLRSSAADFQDLVVLVSLEKVVVNVSPLKENISDKNTDNTSIEIEKKDENITTTKRVSQKSDSYKTEFVYGTISADTQIYIHNIAMEKVDEEKEMVAHLSSKTYHRINTPQDVKVDIMVNTLKDNAVIYTKQVEKKQVDKSNIILSGKPEGNLKPLNNDLTKGIVDITFKNAGTGEEIHDDFKQPVNLTFNYNDIDNNGYVDDDPSINEKYLAPFVLNEKTNKWEKVKEYEHDKDNNKFIVQAKHFSIYALLLVETAINENFDNLKVFPNPYVDSVETEKTIDFEGLSKHNTSLKIYAIDGSLVFEKDGIEDNTFKWNLQNNDNQDIAPGIYIYFLKDDNNNTEKGKLNIVK